MIRITAVGNLVAAAIALGVPVAAAASPARQVAALPAHTIIHYRTIRIDGVDIFYREAGPKDAPTVLLLHGFPSSSFQYRNLIPALADRYDVIAPDYPGFGHSSAPDHKMFAYTFSRCAISIGLPA